MAQDWAVARLGDKGTGHGGYAARPNDQGSPNVFVNNIPVHRTTDHWETHCAGPACHDSNLAVGSKTVIVNNLAIGRVDDDVQCGSLVAEGSPNVFAGGIKGAFIRKAFVAANPYTLEAAGPLLFGTGSAAPHDDPDSVPVPEIAVPVQQPDPAVVIATIPIPADDSTLSTPTPAAKDEGITISCGTFKIKPAIDYEIQLSPNFKLHDLSAGARWKHMIGGQRVRDHRTREIYDISIEDIICNLKGVAVNILEPLRAKFPGFTINSGFRKNVKPSDAPTSQHNKGQAVDVQWETGADKAFNYTERARWCRDNLPFDQLIFEHEKGIWLHISYDRNYTKQRGQQLTFLPPNFRPPEGRYSSSYSSQYITGLVNFYTPDTYGQPTVIV